MKRKTLFDEINKVVEKNNSLFDKCSVLQKELDGKEQEILLLKEKCSLLEKEKAELLVKIEELTNNFLETGVSVDDGNEVNDDVSLDDNFLNDSSDFEKDDADENSGDIDIEVTDNYSRVPNAEIPSCDKEVELSSRYIANGALDIASEAIGRVVLKCATVCNEFAANGNHNAKDLVNLALGRTEVFKSEVLALVSDDMSAEMLSAQINAKEVATIEYFEILLNQL